MNYSSALNAELPPFSQLVPGNEHNIASRRGTEPLFTKALSILAFYDEAMGCSTVVMDKASQAIGTPKCTKQTRFCDLCRKYSHNTTPGLVRTGIWEGTKLPCEKMHLDAVSDSRCANETRIYSCAAGFAFWTTPVFRYGRYAGSLTAGGVLFGRREEAVEKIKNLYKDRIAAEKFNMMLEDVTEKTHSEIQAMARLLGVCAEEISKKAENSNKTICPTTWHEEEPNDVKRQGKTRTKKILPANEKPGAINFSEKERKLLAAYQRGDSDTGSRVLNELMESSIAAFPNNFEAIRLRAIELLVLLSRAASTQPPELEGGAGGASESQATGSETLTEINEINLKRIQESKTTEELMENLRRAAGRMSGKIFSFQGIRHASALRKAQRYIWENYTRKISLEDIAAASGLSAPYFSTIFNEEMGEKLSSHLNRLRVERAASMLKETGKPLKEIAELCGFEDQSWFSKVFKSLTGVSPGKYRERP